MIICMRIGVTYIYMSMYVGVRLSVCMGECVSVPGDFPTASGGLPPRLLLPSERFGLLPGAWGAPNKGNADGAVGIFGNSGRVWATALRPVPPKKGLVPYLPVRWGGQQIHRYVWGGRRSVYDCICMRVRVCKGKVISLSEVEGSYIQECSQESDWVVAARAEEIESAIEENSQTGYVRGIRETSCQGLAVEQNRRSSILGL